MGSFSGLLNNSALMLVLCVIYDTFNIHAIESKYLRNGLTGVLVGTIAIAVMLSPWSLEPGVFFDTRWVLLSLCGLFFGLVPTSIAVLIAGAFRLYQGGAGGVVGTLVIVSTACVGLAWRHWQQQRDKPLDAIQLYIFGILVQLAMLSCMVFMPEGMRMNIIKAVAPPVLVIYPFLTVMVGLILKKQEDRRATDKALIKEIRERKIAEQSAKESEAAVRKSKEEWEKTFNAITDIVSFQDTDQRIVKINRAGCDSLGLAAEKIIGRHCYELFHNSKEPCPDCPLPVTSKTFEPHTREIFNDNLSKTFLVSSAPVFDGNGTLTHLTHVAKDITEMKKLEEELFQAQKMESIGTLAGGIAHDFNNILAAVMGYAEIAKEKISHNDNAGREIEQIIKSSIRAAELVRHILTFSRKSEHSLEPCSPHLIIREALQMLRASFPATIEIREQIDADCGEIMADPTKIHQIIVNLCTNSLHAMDGNKGVLEIKLYQKQITAQEISRDMDNTPGAFMVLEIKDTGHGMDQETLENIFDPFFTTKEVGKGTGLGLSVIHGIIKDYSGFIRINSTLGKGSAFRVHIPLLKRESVSQDTATEAAKVMPTGSERVLVVDDEQMIVDLHAKSLKRLGYHVTATTSSLDALEKISSEPDGFDLVITDQTMPEMTGVELAREIMGLCPGLPIILCTGYSRVFSEEDARAGGIRKQLDKPVSRALLATSIRQVMDEA